MNKTVPGMDANGTYRAETLDEASFMQGVKDCVPTLLGYLSIGFAAGVIEMTAGLSLTETALISLILYAGSAQFIAAGMLASNGSAAAIIFTIFSSICATCCSARQSRRISAT